MNMHAKTDARRERVSSRVMRAAVLTGPRTIDLREVPMPEPGPGEVRVRLEGCGVCASNVTPWTGPEWMRFPTAPGDLGHEGWGVVDAVGRDVRQLREGDRVTTLFQKSYAEFDVGPADQAVPLPSALGDAPLPGEPLGCAVNVIRRARLQPGETVAVVGLGFMGLLLVRLASLAGVRVVAVGRKPQAQARALDMGAAMAVATQDAAASAAEIARDGLFDCVIEATGCQEPLDLAATLTTTRGRLVIAGYHQDAPRRVDMQLWNWRGLDVINAHERDPAVYLEGTREAIALVAAGQLDPAPLYTHVLPFDRLNEALELAATRPEGFVKSLVVMP